MISIDAFKNIDMRVGEILSAHKVEGADRLLRLSVNLGEAAPRQIISGIAEYFPDPSELVGKQAVFVANLEPRTIRGLESQGMIMAVGGGEEPFALLSPHAPALPGSRVK